MDRAWSIRAVEASWPQTSLPPGQMPLRGPGAQGEPDFPVLRNVETLRGCWSLEMGL